MGESQKEAVLGALGNGLSLPILFSNFFHIFSNFFHIVFHICSICFPYFRESGPPRKIWKNIENNMEFGNLV